MEENMMNNLSKYINLGEMEVRMLNPLIWAYVGDVVYELYIRTYLISKGKRTSHDLHKISIKYVKAEAQSGFLEKVLPFLNEEEENIVRRGRNTKTYHVPKNADVIDYRRATALEALIGFLYLMKRFDRLDEIMGLITEAAL